MMILTNPLHQAPNEAEAKTNPPPMPWYVAYCKPHQEALADENLRRQRYQTIMPLYKQVKLVRKKWVTKMEAMFPRYLFFQPEHVEHSIAPVRSTLGVATVVRFGNVPATLTDDSLQNLLSLVALHNLEDDAQLSPFQPGVAVEVVEGAFATLRGLVAVNATTRVTVLLDMLGKQQSLELPPAALRIIAHSELKLGNINNMGEVNP